MKKNLNFNNARLHRRHWLTMVIGALAGCGGGSDGAEAGGQQDSGSGSGSGSGAAQGSDPSEGSGQTAGEGQTSNGTGTVASPGTGGTGISVLGPISAFGSVVINGVHYDERQARITLDGSGASSASLRLGMVADIEGVRSADGLTGMARTIDVWSIAQGRVTSVGSGSFTVMGMNISLRSSTFMGVSGLSVGQLVKVWGLQADARGSHWQATRVDATTSETVVVTGTVVGSEDNFSVNGLALDGDLTEGLASGGLYRLQGQWDEDKVEVKAVRRFDLLGGTASGQVVEIEGLVTATLSGSYFMLGSVRVNAAGVIAAAAALRLGQDIEVYGHWEGSVLVATKIELEDDH